MLTDVPSRVGEAPRSERDSEQTAKVLELKGIIASIQGGARDAKKIEMKLNEIRRLDAERWESEGGLETAFGNGVGTTFRWLDAADGVDEELLNAWKVRNKSWLETRAPLLTQGDVMKYTLLTEKAASLKAILEVEEMEKYAVELQLALAYLESESNSAQAEKAELARQNTSGSQKRSLMVFRRRSATVGPAGETPGDRAGAP